MRTTCILLAAAAVCGGRCAAQGIRAEVYSEVKAQALNESASFNPDNMYDLGNFAYFIRGDVVFKSDLAESGTALIDVQCQYAPAVFSSSDAVNAFSIKEMYLNLRSDLLALRLGKQYMKWGSAALFSVIDVVNTAQSPLDTENTPEGNPIVDLSAFLGEYVSVDAVSVAQQDSPTSLEDLPLIIRISGSYENISLFLFTKLRKDDKAEYGGSLDLAFPLGELAAGGLYAEGLWQREQKRTVVEETDSVFTLTDETLDNVYKATAGTRGDLSFSSLKWLDGVSLTCEYCYNSGNWSHDMFATYSDWLGTLVDQADAHAAALAEFALLRNARHYLYAQMAFRSLLWTDFNVQAAWILNLEDASGLVIPDIQYQFNKGNIVLGLKALLAYGEDATEFGSVSFRSQGIVYAQYSY